MADRPKCHQVMLCRSASNSSGLMWTRQRMFWLNKSSAINHIPLPSISYMVTLGKLPALFALAACSNTFAERSSMFIVLCVCNRNIGALLQQLPGSLYEGRIDGLLLDLGVSSMQVSNPLCALHCQCWSLCAVIKLDAWQTNIYYAGNFRLQAFVDNISCAFFCCPAVDLPNIRSVS